MQQDLRHCRAERIARASLVIQQRVMRDRQEIAAVRVTVVFVGPDGRPRRVPAAWLAALAAAGPTEASG